MQKADSTEMTALNDQGRYILQACDTIARDGLQIIAGDIGGTNTHQTIDEVLNKINPSILEDPLSTVNDSLIPDIRQYWNGLISRGAETISSWKKYKKTDPRLNPWKADKLLSNVVTNLTTMRRHGHQKMSPSERWGHELPLHNFDIKKDGTPRVTSTDRTQSNDAITLLLSFNNKADKQVLLDRAIAACEMIVSQGLVESDDVITDGDYNGDVAKQAKQFSHTALALLDEKYGAIGNCAATMISTRQLMDVPKEKYMPDEQFLQNRQRYIDLQVNIYKRMKAMGCLKAVTSTHCDRQIGDGSSLTP